VPKADEQLLRKHRPYRIQKLVEVKQVADPRYSPERMVVATDFIEVGTILGVYEGRIEFEDEWVCMQILPSRSSA
jgi:hypothetical protein